MNNKDYQIEHYKDIKQRLDMLDSRVYEIAQVVTEIHHLRLDTKEIQNDVQELKEKTRNVGKPCNLVLNARQEVISAKKTAGFIATFFTLIVFPIVTIILKALGVF